MIVLLVLLLHAEALAVPGQVDDARVGPEGDPGDGVAEDVHHHDRSLRDNQDLNFRSLDSADL